MKKIVIFGSTGSIGSSLLKIIKNDQKNFKIELLTANKNYKKLIKQAKFFNVKNIVLTDYNSYLIAIKLLKNTKIKVFKNSLCILSYLFLFPSNKLHPRLYHHIYHTTFPLPKCDVYCCILIGLHG